MAGIIVAIIALPLSIALALASGVGPEQGIYTAIVAGFVQGWKYYDPDEDPDGPDLKKVPKQVRVYEITGPMFFGDADQLAGVSFKDFTKVIVKVYYTSIFIIL